jgi:TonB family protein
MSSLFLFLVKSTLSLSLLYLAYRLLLREETFFKLSRLVLLFLIVISVIIPFLNSPQLFAPAETIRLNPIFQSHPVLEETIPTAVSAEAVQPSKAASETIQTNEVSFKTIFLSIYLSGVFISFLILFYSFISVLLLFRKARKVSLDGIRLMIIADDIPAFSFGRYILISQHDYDTNPEAIITHERSHIRMGHFYDLMLMELAKVIFWFNPLVYRLARDLKEIHEFQADHSTLHSGIDATQYQLLIIQKCVGHQKFALANSFNHCQIKNRIVMMNKHKTSKAWRWKVATFLPLLALLLMAFGKSGEEPINKKIQNEKISTYISETENSSKTTSQEIIQFPSESRTIASGGTNHSEDNVRNEEQITQRNPKVIKGKVVDEYGNAIEGVSVVASKAIKTTTDANGNFELEMLQDLPLWFKREGLRTTARTPPEFEKSTIVKMSSNIMDMGISVTTYTSKKNTTVAENNSINEVNKNDTSKNTKIYTIVDQMPEFPGGVFALRKYIAKQVRYPAIAEEDKAEGQVVVNFVINREGQVWYAKVIKSAHPALDQEAVRVIYSMPKWSPGIHHGDKVNVAYTTTINFLYTEAQKGELKLNKL